MDADPIPDVTRDSVLVLGLEDLSDAVGALEAYAAGRSETSGVAAAVVSRGSDVAGRPAGGLQEVHPSAVTRVTETVTVEAGRVYVIPSGQACRVEAGRIVVESAEADARSHQTYADRIVETLHEPLLVLHHDLRVRSANRAFYDHFKVDPEGTEGRLVYDLGDGQWDVPALRALLESVLPGTPTVDDYEVRHTFENIGERVLLVNARRLDHVPLVLLGLRDVTERARAEEVIRQSEERFRTLAETVPGAVFTMTAAGEVDYVNRQHGELTGVAPEAVLGTAMWPGLIHPDDRAAAEGAWAAAREAKGRYEVRYRIRNGDGGYCWVIARARPVFDAAGDLDRWFGTLTDVDALARAEAEVRELNATLEARVGARTREVREMAARLTTAEQAERERIARVLHDDLQQQLVALSMTLDLLRRPADSAEAERLHAQAEEVLDGSIAVARSLATELSPAVLESDRVEEMLRWLELRKESLYGMAIAVDVEGPCTVADRTLRVLLYQALREVLLNVVKHAGTREARLRTWTDDGLVAVRVEDDGVGFDPSDPAVRRGGFGLSHVRDRVERAGGWVGVDSAPGAGTRVTIAVPGGSAGTDGV